MSEERGTPLDDFDYELPESSIAQAPPASRTDARLLDALDPDRPPVHRTVADLPALLGPGDVLVVNDSRVLPARLSLRKASGGHVEVLLLSPRLDRGEDCWEALVRPSRRVQPGTLLYAPGMPAEAPPGAPGAPGATGGTPDDASAEPLVEALGPAPAAAGEPPDEAGVRLVRLLVADAAARHGTLALPPYIRRELREPERYQTVYARSPGSVAAPTAGLHFTPQLLEGCRAAGAEIVTVDLAVGLGTFRPISTHVVEEHTMHSEHYFVPDATLAACRGGRRVIAVGTTTLRALETVAAGGPREGETSIYIHGNFEWKCVDVLMTNFHLPRSSLLVLLEAFAGPRWRALYGEALSRGYRFLSFGDAMIVGRRAPAGEVAL